MRETEISLLALEEIKKLAGVEDQKTKGRGDRMLAVWSLANEHTRERALLDRGVSLPEGNTRSKPLSYIYDVSFYRRGLFVSDLPDANWIEYVRDLEEFAKANCPCPRRVEDGSVIADLAIHTDCPLHGGGGE